MHPGSVVAQSPSTERGFHLEQNFPNPFTPGVSPTIITYRTDGDGPVRLVVYNLLAQEVVVLTNERQPAGLHRIAWDGIDQNGETVPAGVYWYKLEANGKTALKRLRVAEGSIGEQPLESRAGAVSEGP